MKSAYLYVRVSTDEQKRKGYSLPEQEDRLLKYCAYNDIKVKGIYREDFSAKNFNRPEWKKLITLIKKSSSSEENNILFIKWDRFSRNIEYAYEMIGILRKHHTTAMAIDQPIDLSIPESAVMLAVYLSVPEAENSRRALNTSNGMRRAKQMGKYPNKAPLGFCNLTALDGKKYIAPRQPEADIVKWGFQQLAKNSYTIEEVRKMACGKGLKCSRSNFWKLIRNPVYCGLIIFSPVPNVQEIVKAIHEPLISEDLFYEVQDIINSKRKLTNKSDELKASFPLKGYLSCPVCDRKLRGSFSQGSSKKYPYYHCSGKCKTRFKADSIDINYIDQLQKLILSRGVAELFNLILEDVNVSTQKTECLLKKNQLQKQLAEQDSLISKARKLFVMGDLKFDDFSQLKKEYQTISNGLKKELNIVMTKLRCINQQFKVKDISYSNIFGAYHSWDITEKKQIIDLIPPKSVSMKSGEVSVKLSDPLSKILFFKSATSKGYLKLSHE